MNDQTTLNHGEIRRKFEGLLSRLAKMYGCDPKQFRDYLKSYLKLKGVIKNSTTELSVETLNELANKIDGFIVATDGFLTQDEIDFLNLEKVFEQ